MKQFLAALVLYLAPVIATSQEINNEVFDELVAVGLQIPDGPKVKLPEPLLKPGQTPRIDDEWLERAAGNVPVELFLKRTLTAPFYLKIDSVEKANEERCAQMVNLRFIVYGKLADVIEGDVFKQVLGGKQKKAGKGPQAKATELTAEELKMRGIRLLDSPKAKEAYDTVAMPLLDKVQVEGVTRGLRTTASSSVLYATVLDERFSKDKEYPNTWRHILAGGAFGPTNPYAGLGGYALVTALPESKVVPKGALFVEMVYLLHEPYAWFDGRNLIRAKLPIPLQNNVREFRRNLSSE